MTSKQLINKMLQHGFEKCAEDKFGKNVNGETVIVSISENDSATAGKWFMPHIQTITNIGIEDYYTWTARGINQALAKRGCF